jgi:hypothetical protein
MRTATRTSSLADSPRTPELPLLFTQQRRPAQPLADELLGFREFGQATRQQVTRLAFPDGRKHGVPTFINEFWTARQRQASSLHEISYRACFKPQLPRFFIERLTAPGNLVYDPFMGRGTTLIEAALLGRVPVGNDVNPLSAVLTRPRLQPPELSQIEARLLEIGLNDPADVPDDLLVFYHEDTLRAISSLKRYLQVRKRTASLDALDEWIAMVTLNRLTGHSRGFLSVYTLPPNQAVSVRSQRVINQRRNQVPPRRDVIAILLKKSRQLLKELTAAERANLARVSPEALLLTKSAEATPEIASNSVALVVTSPPFLNVVQYAADNWLRCWFLDIDPQSVKLTVPAKLETWQAAMAGVFRELSRVLQPGGHVAFEVGEVHSGKTKLEEFVLPCGVSAGLEPLLILINDQQFTKTANCWGVDNMAKGTNTNRIVLFRKPGKRRKS